MERNFASLRVIMGLCLVVLGSAAVAQPRGATPKGEEAPRPGSKFSLTVYSTADPATFDPQQVGSGGPDDGRRRMPIPGYGVVREIRRLPLVVGENLVKFIDVASEIDPTTVSFKSLTAPETTSVLEQNFEYDLISPDALLQKYLGKSIIINRKQEPLAGERTRMPETIEAKLLSFTADQLVLQTNNKQLPVQLIPRTQDITEIKLFDLQTGLITKPTLVWKVEARQAGDHEALVSYQTQGITWRADYGLTVSKDETAADLSAWVTLVNQSGAAYPNAKLKLVAGDLQRLRPEPTVWRDSGGSVGAAAEGFKEKSFFEYHLYTLGRATSIANNSTKQVELFPTKLNVPVEKVYVYGSGEAGPYGAQPQADRAAAADAGKRVDVFVRFKNSEKAGLGIPLPAGRVRVYKRDDQDADDPAGVLEFVGEEKIGHTARDEEVLLRVGSAFDVVGEHKQTDFTFADRTITESFEIKLRNHKNGAVTVLISEPLFRWSKWEVTACSEKFTKADARTVHIPVTVGAGEEKKVTYSVKYTW